MSSVSRNDASICGAVAGLEPTNQTRPTMRARIASRMASNCSSVACGADARAIRPAAEIWSTSRAQR